MVLLLEKEKIPTSSLKKSASRQRRLMAFPEKEMTKVASSEKIIEESKVNTYIYIYY